MNYRASVGGTRERTGNTSTKVVTMCIVSNDLHMLVSARRGLCDRRWTFIGVLRCCFYRFSRGSSALLFLRATVTTECYDVSHCYEPLCF
jgi:hypothetical protein